MKGSSKWGLIVGVVALVFGSVVGPQTVLAKEAKKEIVIGTNLPLTGILAMAGAEQQWAYQTAVNDVNKAGGVLVKEYGKKLPVRLIVADDESDPGKAAAAVERLIKLDKVDLLLGGFAAPFGVIPGCITAEKYKKYYHTTICLIPPWLEHKFKWSTLFFFDLVQACAVPFEIWNTLPKDQRPQKPALIMEDTFDGRALLLLDEPSLGLAPLVVNLMFETVQTLNQKGMTIILVEQNVYQTLQLADYVYVLQTGRLVLKGPGTELLSNPEFQRAYLGMNL